MITYRATLAVPHETVARVSGWIQAHRRAYDVRPWQRAATCWTQAVLVLRWYTDSTDLAQPARDAHISLATGYRYLDEAIDIIAERGPDLHLVLAAARERGETFMCLDGTMIETTACHARTDTAGALTCGTPANTTVTEATSTSSPTPADTRSGHPRSNPAAPTTSPPPAPTPCPPSTPPPRPACRPCPTRDTPAPESAS